MHCTSLFKYICFKMGNIPSCCGIISKHMYRLILHKMTTVRMKITKNFLEEDPKAPFNHKCLRYYYTLKFKHPFTYTHVHTGTLQVCKNIYKLHGKSCRASFFKKHSYPPPFQNFMADENKYFGIEIHENKFSVRAHSCWKQSVPIKFPSHPPPSESNGRPLVYTGNQTIRK